MAHLAKFSGGKEGANLYAHWSREQDEKGNYITYSRENGGGHIDRTLTENNFTIGEIHDREWIAERLKNVYQKPNQKKPVETCDIIVTLPQSESKDIENVKQFMQAAYNSLKKQYGERNNIVGCWVHMDEAQPHMHFAFLPISERNSKQKPEFKEKLSTRAYWPKKNSLQEMHRTLQKDINKELGRIVDGLNNGITKEQGGNKTIEELKAETRREQLRLKTFGVKDEELGELHGEKKTSTFGRDEYYKLTPAQHNRLLSIAKMSLQQNKVLDFTQRENEHLKSENTRLKKWMNYYLSKADEKAKKELGESVDKLLEDYNNLETDKANLLTENKALKKQNKILEQSKKTADLLQKFVKETGKTKELSNWSKSVSKPQSISKTSSRGR